MHTFNARTLIGGLLVAASLSLAACGSDGGGDSRLKLGVVDAPVDGAEKVVVKFTGVELRGPEDAPILIEFDTPKTIDLLKYSGTASAELLDQPVPAGRYTQIRLQVLADGDPNDSYIQLADGSVQGLRVPSGPQSGLKLVSGFDAPSGGVANFTIDFDLRKAVTCPPGQNGRCLLKPALRLVDNDAVGNIQGTISPARVPEGCTPGVYLYAGTVTAPQDYDSTASSTAAQPLASKIATVSTTSAGYYYQLTFLAPGSYTVALTCDADLDTPDQADEGIVFEPIVTDIVVSAGQTETVDLP